MSDSVAANHVNLDLRGQSKDRKEDRRRALLSKSWVFAANTESPVDDAPLWSRTAPSEFLNNVVLVFDRSETKTAPRLSLGLSYL